MNNINLSEPADQTRFARLVGVSQPSISSYISKGRLTRGATFGQWIAEDTEHLRTEAGGRASSLQDRQAAARIEESEVKAAIGRLDYFSKLEALVIAGEVEQVLSGWAGYANREYRSGFDSLVMEIERRYGIEIDRTMVTEFVGTTIDRVRRFAEKSAEPYRESSETVQPAEGR